MTKLRLVRVRYQKHDTDIETKYSKIDYWFFFPLCLLYFRMLCRSDVVWHCVALSVASISTVVYLFIQWSHKLLTCNYGKGLLFLGKLFPYSCKNVHIRSCQFLYWPVLLQSKTSRYNISLSYCRYGVRHVIPDFSYCLR